jgi:hypothetical protein
MALAFREASRAGLTTTSKHSPIPDTKSSLLLDLGRGAQTPVRFDVVFGSDECEEVDKFSTRAGRPYSPLPSRIPLFAGGLMTNDLAEVTGDVAVVEGFSDDCPIEAGHFG